MKIRTAKQTSVVTNREQYYVIMESQNIRYTMSIGEKSYNTITQMLEENNNFDALKEVNKELDKNPYQPIKKDNDEPLDLKDENKKLDNLIKTKKSTK